VTRPSLSPTLLPSLDSSPRALGIWRGCASDRREEARFANAFLGPRCAEASASRGCDTSVTVSSTRAIEQGRPTALRSAILIGLSQLQACDVRTITTGFQCT
jgi:hypothetical protein